MTNSAALVRCNALRMPVRSASVDAFLFSPPYFSLRDYKDGGESLDGQIGAEATPRAYVDTMVDVMRECVRGLKPGGSIFVNVGDKYSASHTGVQGVTGDRATRSEARSKQRMKMATTIPAKSLMGLPWRLAIRCIDELGLILRAEIIWSKANGLPESVTDRVRRSHEHILHFTLNGDYFSGVDEIRSPHATDPTVRPSWQERKSNGEPVRAGLDGAAAVGNVGGMAGHPLGALPGSVWTIATEPLHVPDYFVEDADGWRMLDRAPLWKYVRYRTDGDDWSPVSVSEIDHFAAWPSEIPRRLIHGWVPTGWCTACGEPRRPTADKASDGPPRNDAGDGGRGTRGLPGYDDIQRSGWHEGVKRTITGYSCGCPDASSPTSPAVVVDPFSGTGTTVFTARALGRYGIGFDLSADYIRLARWRIWQSGDAAKVVNRTNRERQGVLL